MTHRISTCFEDHVLLRTCVAIDIFYYHGLNLLVFGRLLYYRGVVFWNLGDFSARNFFFCTSKLPLSKCFSKVKLVFFRFKKGTLKKNQDNFRGWQFYTTEENKKNAFKIAPCHTSNSIEDYPHHLNHSTDRSCCNHLSSCSRYTIAIISTYNSYPTIIGARLFSFPASVSFIFV